MNYNLFVIILHIIVYNLLQIILHYINTFYFVSSPFIKFYKFYLISSHLCCFSLLYFIYIKIIADNHPNLCPYPSLPLDEK